MFDLTVDSRAFLNGMDCIFVLLLIVVFYNVVHNYYRSSNLYHNFSFSPHISLDSPDYIVYLELHTLNPNLILKFTSRALTDTLLWKSKLIIILL